MKKIIVYFIAILAAAVPVISLAITGDPFSGGGTQGPSYKVEWSNEIILPYEYVGFPNISPDGKKIVFLKYKGQDDYYNEIWTANSDGTEAKALLSEDYTDYNSPVLSPDGAKIAFVKQDYAIWMFTIGETADEPITGKSYEKGSPVWWPDGSKIIYYQGAPFDESVPVEQMGLYKLDFATSSVDQFGEAGWEGPVAFSPDNQTLVIRENQDLLFLSTDGTLQQKKTVITPLELGEEPVWSPNGKYIILGNILYVIATGEEIPFLPDDVVNYKEGEQSDFTGPRSITLSKDGKKIAFRMRGPKAKGKPFSAKIKILDLTWK